MQEVWTRIVENMIERTSGPMHLRLILQPVMASVLAIIAGLKDAKAGRSPYFWSLLNEPAQRAAMLRDGWKSMGKVFVVAMVLDVVYQLVVQRFVYPLEVLLTGIILAVVPYLIVRGLVTRLARRG